VLLFHLPDLVLPHPEEIALLPMVGLYVWYVCLYGMFVRNAWHHRTRSGRG
jgi:hypothetical protein